MAEYIVDSEQEHLFYGDKYEELIRCKDCKHRPRRIEENGGNRFHLEFPDYRCPCRCDDDWYNWMPDDDWYCGNAERKEE